MVNTTNEIRGRGHQSPIYGSSQMYNTVSAWFLFIFVFSLFPDFGQKRITLTTLGDQAISSIIFLSCSNLNMSLLALLSSV